MNSIIDLISNLPTIEENDDYYDGGIEDMELDKIVEKMRAHGLKITKSQLAHCRNEYENQEQSQSIGMFM